MTPEDEVTNFVQAVLKNAMDAEYLLRDMSDSSKSLLLKNAEYLRVFDIQIYPHRHPEKNYKEIVVYYENAMYVAPYPDDENTSKAIDPGHYLTTVLVK